jgi:hypothetical protein
VGDPLWLRAFTAVEGALGPRVEEFVHGQTFSTAVVIVQKVQSGVSGVVERRTRRVWHLVNLPAGSDLRKLRNQVGDLDHEVRLLRGAVESEARRRSREARRAKQEEAAGDAGAAASARVKDGKGSGSDRGNRLANSGRRDGTGAPRSRAQRRPNSQRDQGDHGVE